MPSGFLEHVFAEFGVASQVIPNIIDLDTFHPAQSTNAARVRRDCGEYIAVITRNLEPIYGLETAIRCVALVRDVIPGVVLKIAGSGPQRAERLRRA